MAAVREGRSIDTSMAFTPDGRSLLSGSMDGTVCLWNVASGQAEGTYNWKIGRVNAVAISPDGMVAAA